LEQTQKKSILKIVGERIRRIIAIQIFTFVRFLFHIIITKCARVQLISSHCKLEMRAILKILEMARGTGGVECQRTLDNIDKKRGRNDE
jgi:hypothetical protein